MLRLRRLYAGIFLLAIPRTYNDVRSEAFQQLSGFWRLRGWLNAEFLGAVRSQFAIGRRLLSQLIFEFRIDLALAKRSNLAASERYSVASFMMRV